MEDRAGDHAVALALALGADVDEHGAVQRGGQRLLGLEPVEPCARCAQQVVDRRARHRREV